MSEPATSPDISPVLPLGGARADGLVSVAEAGPLGMIAVRCDISAAGAAVADVAGLAVPAPLTGTGDAAHGLLWMAPDELALILPRADAPATAQRLRQALTGRHALVADVSDARAHFTLTGREPALRDVLSKLTPADLRPAAAPLGTVRRTRLAQVAGGLWLLDAGSAHVFCFRSVARYTFDLLANAADPAAALGFFDR